MENPQEQQFQQTFGNTITSITSLASGVSPITTKEIEPHTSAPLTVKDIENQAKRYHDLLENEFIITESEK